MIVYGTYHSKFKKLPMPEAECPNCNSKGDMRMVVGCTTAHVMFIPVFAYGKDVYQHCSSCGKSYYPDPEQEIAAERFKKAARKPWYLFFWLWILLAFALFIGGTMLWALIQG